MIYHTDCKICGGSGYILEVIDGYETFRECECIQPRRVERYLLHSGVRYREYAEKNLDNFREDTEEARRMKLLARQFLADQNAAGFGLFGKPGTGKTHLCIAVCQELTRRRFQPHLYFSYRAEMQKLRAAFYHDEEYSEMMDRWQSCRILYIDDLLKFTKDSRGNLNSQDLQIIYDIVNTRYMNSAITIFSSEYSVAEICEIDSALGSRIFEMVNPYGMKCEGKNRRFSSAYAG